MGKISLAAPLTHPASTVFLAVFANAVGPGPTCALDELRPCCCSMLCAGVFPIVHDQKLITKILSWYNDFDIIWTPVPLRSFPRTPDIVPYRMVYATWLDISR